MWLTCSASTARNTLLDVAAQGKLGRVSGSTALSHAARQRTHSAIAANVVIPANLANTISVKIKGTL